MEEGTHVYQKGFQRQKLVGVGEYCGKIVGGGYQKKGFKEKKFGGVQCR